MLESHDVISIYEQENKLIRFAITETSKKIMKITGIVVSIILVFIKAQLKYICEDG